MFINSENIYKADNFYSLVFNKKIKKLYFLIYLAYLVFTIILYKSIDI